MKDYVSQYSVWLQPWRTTFVYCAVRFSLRCYPSSQRHQSLWTPKGCIPTKARQLSSGLHLWPNNIISNRQKSRVDFSVNSCTFWNLSFFCCFAHSKYFQAKNFFRWMLLIKAELNLWEPADLLSFCVVVFFFFSWQNSVTSKTLISQLWFVPKCFSMQCLNASSACMHLSIWWQVGCVILVLVVHVRPYLWYLALYITIHSESTLTCCPVQKQL